MTSSIHPCLPSACTLHLPVQALQTGADRSAQAGDFESEAYGMEGKEGMEGMASGFLPFHFPQCANSF